MSPLTKKQRTDLNSTSEEEQQKHSIFEDSSPSLLYVPIQDFSPKKQIGETNTNVQVNESSNEEKLLLMQLPSSGLTMKDLLSEDIKIVGSSNNGDDDENQGLSCCCLVLESSGRSFTMNKVETSNALIAIPPDQPDRTTTTIIKKDSSSSNTNPISEVDNSDQNDQSVILCRRTRHLADPSSFFIELNRHCLNRQHLHDLLSKHIFNPFEEKIDNPYSSQQQQLDEKPLTNGCTIQYLADTLQCATTEIHAELTFKMPNAFRLPNKYSYVYLHQQVIRETTTAILSSIAEADDNNDNTSWVRLSKGDSANDNIVSTLSVKESVCIQKVMECLLTDERNDDDKTTRRSIIQRCLKNLLYLPNAENQKYISYSSSQESNSIYDQSLVLQVDIKKIATFVAHEIFNSRSTPWEVNEFISEWHSKIPGVGPEFEVSIDILGGVALLLKKGNNSSDNNNESKILFQSGFEKKKQKTTSSFSSNTSYLKYFPERDLPYDPKSRFERLFKEKEEWTLIELEPFIENLVDRNNSKTELLLKYTLVVTDENGDACYRSR